eukprot:TRINITY_DN13173_c0_g1_i1.p1 TRINITY_DN13173_c0_g1~~TRINITY_DN13173_c0_g1_i1.p1  ORF type:complete len:352 (+),score=20.37 TRINITY_DN13173_c0_g1_i1:680-1735(+)
MSQAMIHLREGIFVHPNRITNLPIERTRPRTPYPVREMVDAGVWDKQTEGLLICHHCFQPFTPLGQKRVYRDHVRDCKPRGEMVYDDPDSCITVRDYSSLWHSDEVDVCSNLASLIGTFVRDKIAFTDMAIMSMFAMYAKPGFRANLTPRSNGQAQLHDYIETPFEAPVESSEELCLVGAFSHQAVPIPGSGMRHPNAISCFAVLPPYRRRGFGAFMVEFSRHIGKTSDPLHLRPFSVERPLSLRGRNSHRKVWRRECVAALQKIVKKRKGGKPTGFTLAQVAKEAKMAEEDVISTLRSYRMLTPGTDGSGPVIWMGDDGTHDDTGLFKDSYVVNYQPVIRLHSRTPLRGD